jgi:hypothetical protein
MCVARDGDVPVTILLTVRRTEYMTELRDADLEGHLNRKRKSSNVRLSLLYPTIHTRTKLTFLFPPSQALT